MKYILFFAALIFQRTAGITQSLKLPVGKKFIVNVSTNNLTEVTMMDTHIQMHNDGTIRTEYELTAVAVTGYKMKKTPVHMDYVMTMNGIEKKFDTDNPTDKENPLYAQVMELINHPQIVAVENNKVIQNAQLSLLNPYGMQDDHGKLFLTVPTALLHLGYQWSDSTGSEKSKTLNQYILMKLTDSTVVLHVNNDFSMHNIVEQEGMKITQNLKGFSNGDRTYNRLNGLLKEEDLDMDISGSTETQEMTSPITMKLIIKTKVQEELKK